MAGLPYDYAIRNLARRPLRTALSALSSALVAALLVATMSFVRGLEHTFSGAARADTAILLSSVAERDLVRSAVSAELPELVAASVPGIRQIGEVAAVSGEIHMATNLRLGPQPATGEADPVHAAFLRGVTERAFLVHEAVTIVEGRPPGPGEVLVGRIVPRQLGVPETALAVGRTVRFEGGTYTVSGRFHAPGTTMEAEIWTGLHELRGRTRRDDSSAVFVRVENEAALADLDLFARRRLDLELTMIPTAVYYRELASYFQPILVLSWVLAGLIVGAALFGGANTLNAAVQDRLRELAALRALGYSGFALVRSLAAESLLIAASGGVLGLLLAELLLRQGAVRLAMTAFEIRTDAVAVLTGFLGVLAVAIVGAAPAALRAMRLPIATGLQEP